MLCCVTECCYVSGFVLSHKPPDICLLSDERRRTSSRPQRAGRRTKVSRHATSFPASAVAVAHFHLGSWDRSQPGLPEPEAGLLQGAGPRGLRGLAVEEERRQGILLPKMEKVLVCPEGQLSVLVHQRGGKSEPGEKEERILLKQVNGIDSLSFLFCSG